MPHLWLNEDSRGWVAVPLTGDAVVLSGDSRRSVLQGAGVATGPRVELRRSHGGTVEKWVILSGATRAVRVNARPILAGICALKDRDEITLPGGSRLFFSAERLARVEPFPGAEAAVFCARCRKEIQAGVPAVRCPQCGAWCHQNPQDDLPCWAYGPSCPLCDQSTAIDADFRWTPGEL